MIEKKYFLIDITHLKGDKIFPFHLYVFNPQNKKYSPFIYANSPLTKDKREFLKFVIKHQGSPAIQLGQKKTFLRHFHYEEKDIPGLNLEEISEEEKERILRIKILELHDSKSSFQFQNTLRKCIEEDDFLPLIKRAREEIQCFNLKISHSVSLASFLAKKILTVDSIGNRVVCVSYFLARTLNIDGETELADLINAAFFYHIGMTQLEISISQSNIINLDPESKDRYKKHPGLGQHLLRKSKIEINDRTLDIINQHHERVNGSGFPKNKKESSIDFMALILGAISHIFEFSSGKINGSTQPLVTVIKGMKNKNFTTGLEFEFGDTILETLESLIIPVETDKAA